MSRPLSVAVLTISQCFWINLPVGGVAAIVTFFFFKPNEAAKPVEATWKETILQLDLVGAGLMIGLLTCYILALQYGGQTHPWKSATVIGLFVGFVLLLAAFVAWQVFQKEYAMIVPRIVSLVLRVTRSTSTDNIPQFAKRYIWTGALFMVFFSGSYFVVLYYLPLYFQAVHNANPIGSGVRMLALIIPLTFAAIAQGFAFTKIGIVPLFWLIGGSLGAIGSGLFYTMDKATGAGKWIGFQIIVGFAVGLTTQVALQNAQVQVRSEDLSQATAIINCKSQCYACTNPSESNANYRFSSLPNNRRLLLHLRRPVRLQQQTGRALCREPHRAQPRPLFVYWRHSDPDGLHSGACPDRHRGVYCGFTDCFCHCDSCVRLRYGGWCFRELGEIEG
jgi:hypothetical protein